MSVSKLTPKALQVYSFFFFSLFNFFNFFSSCFCVSLGPLGTDAKELDVQKAHQENSCEAQRHKSLGVGGCDHSDNLTLKTKERRKEDGEGPGLKG